MALAIFARWLVPVHRASYRWFMDGWAERAVNIIVKVAGAKVERSRSLAATANCFAATVSSRGEYLSRGSDQVGLYVFRTRAIGSVGKTRLSLRSPEFSDGTHVAWQRLRTILRNSQQRVIRQVHPKVRIELCVVHP